MKIIENALNKEVQEKLKDFIFTKFPLYYLENVTFEHTKKYAPGFGHVFIKDDVVVSEQANLLNLFKDVIKGNVKRCRLFLQLPLNQKLIPKIDPLHIDDPAPHQVYIYYVVDSDGDTVIYKNKKEWKRVTPKQGTILTFDGSLWHTAEQPTKGTRCIINFNVT
jgi:hypothetical protein|tara:strand:+ start:793 stop:1284 length:492 start_codon:yes stop_codon:yes gene_type:complete